MIFVTYIISFVRKLFEHNEFAIISDFLVGKDPPIEKASVSNDSSCISIDTTPCKIITCSTEASDIALTNDACNDSPVEGTVRDFITPLILFGTLLLIHLLVILFKLQ